jgi:hypothetical protein
MAGKGARIADGQWIGIPQGAGTDGYPTVFRRCPVALPTPCQCEGDDRKKREDAGMGTDGCYSAQRGHPVDEIRLLPPGFVGSSFLMLTYTSTFRSKTPIRLARRQNP